jgi:CRP/FNR family cyclic AMP-dependent transcriptional regulator
MTAMGDQRPRFRGIDPRPTDGHARASLLDLDADLGNLLDDNRREAARRQLTARVTAIPTGHWDVTQLQNAGPLHVGLLVLDGVLAREIALDDTVSTELLGPGDLTRPWQTAGVSDLLPAAIRWNALSSVRLAVLDRHVAARLAEWPEINAVVLERLHAHAQRLATTQAISQLHRVDRRVIAIFWHLAERFGRVTRDGVVVPLAISHRLVGQLIGARRPTVSTALTALAQDGKLRRLHDGTWLLPGAPDDSRRPDELEVIRQRRTLMPPANHADVVPLARSSAPVIDHAPQPAHVAATPRAPMSPERDGADSVHDRLRAALEVNGDRRRDLQELQEKLIAARTRLDAQAAVSARPPSG